MKIIVNRLGRRLIHGRRLLQLLKLCLGDIFNGFKGFQQRLGPMPGIDVRLEDRAVLFRVCRW